MLQTKKMLLIFLLTIRIFWPLLYFTKLVPSGGFQSLSDNVWLLTIYIGAHVWLFAALCGVILKDAIWGYQSVAVIVALFALGTFEHLLTGPITDGFSGISSDGSSLNVLRFFIVDLVLLILAMQAVRRHNKVTGNMPSQISS